MSDSTVETPAAPKRRGRPPGKVTRKRHDPEDAPIHGMRGLGGVINQRKGFRYAMLTAKEASKRVWDGYKRVERSDDGPRLKFWMDNDHPGYREGELTLFEIRSDLHAQIHAEAVSESDRRMAGNAQQVNSTGGSGTHARVST